MSGNAVVVDGYSFEMNSESIVINNQVRPKGDFRGRYVVGKKAEVNSKSKAQVTPKKVEVNSTKLRELDLSSNSLQTFRIVDAPNLERLTIQSSSKFELAFDQIPNLTHLYLFDTPIETLKLNHETLPRIENISVTRSKLRSLELGWFPTLRLLRVDRANLGSFVLGDSFPNLVHLGLDTSELKTFSIAFPQPNLEFLRLEGNHLVSFTVNVELPRLDHLIVSYNQLTSFSVRELPKLQVLMLSGNYGLEILNLTRVQVPLLSDLYIGGTKIKSLDPSISSLCFEDE